MCLNIGAKKCELRYPEKSFYMSSDYHDCMSDLYDQIYGENSLQLCRFAYGNFSGLFDDIKINIDRIGAGILYNSVASLNMLECYQNYGDIKLFCDDAYELGYLDFSE